MSTNAGGVSASNDGLGARAVALVEAALWWHLCPVQGGYRHDGDSAGRSVEDTCEQLEEACMALGVQRDDHSGAWMSEEDATAVIAPIVALLKAALAPNVGAERPS